MTAGRDAAPPGRLVTCTGATRGSAWRTLGFSRQELAETGGEKSAAKSAARDRKVPQAERRKARAPRQGRTTPQGVDRKFERRSALRPSDFVRERKKETATGRREPSPGAIEHVRTFGGR